MSIQNVAAYKYFSKVLENKELGSTWKFFPAGTNLLFKINIFFQMG
jgi:hypothetical protein